MSAHRVETEQQAEIERVRREMVRRDREIESAYYGWERPVNRFFHCQLFRECIEALSRARKYPFDNLRVLDVGCGPGTWLLEFVQWGAKPCNIAGIELEPARAASAKERLSGADIRLGDAQMLPWPDESFDVLAQFTMFTSILDCSIRTRIASEMLRALRPDGLILWYDFRFDNPRNKSVRGIGVGEIKRLFPGCTVESRLVTLVPPLARAVVPISWMAAEALETLPFLKTHYLATIHKAQG